MSADWHDILSRVPVPLVPDLTPPGLQDRVPPTLPDIPDMGVDAPSTALWPLQDTAVARFGVRVTAPPDDPRLIAARLVAAAIGRGAEPVILSHVPRSGFDQAGFRVERIHGATETERNVQEIEASQFWSLSVVIDLGDVAMLE